MSVGTTNKHVFSRQQLFEIGKRHLQPDGDTLEKLRCYGILRVPGGRSATPPRACARPDVRRKQCARRRKRGKRAGIHARLKANCSRLALPSLLLSNVRSLDNKLDCLRLLLTSRKEIKHCCVLIFTETWLHEGICDSGIQLDGLASYRADRDTTATGKTRGGGLCVYINNSWCRNTAIVSVHCSELVEVLAVRCRPFYIPREFTAVIIMAVYIPPALMLTGHSVNSTPSSATYKQPTLMASSSPPGILIKLHSSQYYPNFIRTLTLQQEGITC